MVIDCLLGLIPTCLWLQKFLEIFSTVSFLRALTRQLKYRTFLVKSCRWWFKDRKLGSTILMVTQSFHPVSSWLLQEMAVTQ